jgi:hypothetical protein
MRLSSFGNSAYPSLYAALLRTYFVRKAASRHCSGADQRAQIDDQAPPAQAKLLFFFASIKLASHLLR